MKASRNGLKFSHLLFVDDLLLFAKADIKNCCNIREALDTFYELLGVEGQPLKIQGIFLSKYQFRALQ